MQSGWLLVIENEQGRWASAVDEVAGVRRVPRERLTAIPSQSLKASSRSRKRVHPGRSARWLLDADRLFRTLQQTSW